MSRRPLLAAAGLALAAAALAGCDASSVAPAQGSSAPSSQAPSSQVPPSTSAPSQPAVPLTSTAPPPTASASARTSASATPSPVAVHAPVSTAPRSTCGTVTVRVIRGSADRGREFAALQFTNDGSTRCTLNGYPTVTLYRGGQRIGTLSQPASQAASTFDLAPGATAESRLDDYTDCQAPLSDSIHLVVPGSTQRYHRPGELRACTLRVSRLGKPE